MHFENLLSKLCDIYGDRKNINMGPYEQHLHVVVLTGEVFRMKAFCVENYAGQVFGQEWFHIIFAVPA